MGWERKRGKLHELNRLLRGATTRRFLAIDGSRRSRRAMSAMSSRWMPIRGCRASVRQTPDRQDGASAQPAALRSDTRPRRCDGYGILQPRVTPSLPIGTRRFAVSAGLLRAQRPRPLCRSPFPTSIRICSTKAPIVGKGIYDVDAFEAALDGRIPENTVLSHDLLEGIFARAALVSDIEVVEEFPSRYDVAAARQHRWVRGDWQLLPWIFGCGRIRRPRASHVAIPLLGRWKMLDNLRRSLRRPRRFWRLLVGWTLPLREPPTSGRPLFF